MFADLESKSVQLFPCVHVPPMRWQRAVVPVHIPSASTVLQSVHIRYACLRPQILSIIIILRTNLYFISYEISDSKIPVSRLRPQLRMDMLLGGTTVDLPMVPRICRYMMAAMGETLSSLHVDSSLSPAGIFIRPGVDNKINLSPPQECMMHHVHSIRTFVLVHHLHSIRTFILVDRL